MHTSQKWVMKKLPLFALFFTAAYCWSEQTISTHVYLQNKTAQDLNVSFALGSFSDGGYNTTVFELPDYMPKAFNYPVLIPAGSQGDGQTTFAAGFRGHPDFSHGEVVVEIGDGLYVLHVHTASDGAPVRAHFVNAPGIQTHDIGGVLPRIDYEKCTQNPKSKGVDKCCAHESMDIRQDKYAHYSCSFPVTY